MKNQARYWGLEKFVLDAILAADREHIITDVRDGRKHESKDRIDCQNFPSLLIHIKEDSGHYTDPSLEAEVLIKCDIALSPITHIRLVGHFLSHEKKDEGNPFKFKVTRVEELKNGSLLKRTDAPDLKKKKAA